MTIPTNLNDWLWHATAEAQATPEVSASRWWAVLSACDAYSSPSFSAAPGEAAINALRVLGARRGR